MPSYDLFIRYVVDLKAVLLRCLNHEPDSLDAFASVAAMEGLQFQD
jgi:hypothetical protein